ncbi:hypothetical protein E3E12_08015 [Formicincola oecophyllae]|uniref:Uncharacterized protein n=1 Tax=Formicincola oecophyllae TaxID=2558361 RepID=A0A4Y6UCM5_9PROT|nr:hypothetical protein [Formicincola oecophyllae]QDH14141.1 hypothetical protein E3E12_08015 [Formicincola oecophyllae]
MSNPQNNTQSSVTLYTNVQWKGAGRYINFRCPQSGWQVVGYVLQACTFEKEEDVYDFEGSAWVPDFDGHYHYEDVFPGPYPDGSHSPHYDPTTGTWPKGYDPHNPWAMAS